MAAETTAAVQTADQPKNWFDGVKVYVDGLRDEMRRVSWPTRLQVQATTAVVIISVFLFAAYFALIDAVLGQGINRVFHSLAGR